VTRNHLKKWQWKTIGTDFDQFCAVCELIFSRPIKCCSRIYDPKKSCLRVNKKLNAALQTKIYRNSDSALHSLQGAAARWRQRPNWPYNHVFEKSRYLSYFSNFLIRDHLASAMITIVLPRIAIIFNVYFLLLISCHRSFPSPKSGIGATSLDSDSRPDQSAVVVLGLRAWRPPQRVQIRVIKD